jgi:glutamine synthetase
MTMTPKEAIQFGRDNGARRLMSGSRTSLGLAQHISYRSAKSARHRGRIRIDGSSIRGWAAINESDMLLILTQDRVHGPVFETPTLCMIGDILIRPRGSAIYDPR